MQAELVSPWSTLVARYLPGEPRLFAREYKSGREELCIFVHGFGDSHCIWIDFLPQVIPHFDLIALDLRGHGDSDWDDAADYSIAAYTADVARIIEHNADRSIILVGHSIGAEIVIRNALRYRPIIKAVVAVDSGPEADPEVLRYIRQEVDAENKSYASVDDFATQWIDRRPLATSSLLTAIAPDILRPRPDGTFVLKRDPALTRSGVLERERSFAAEPWCRLHELWCPFLLVRGGASAVLRQRVAEQTVGQLRQGELQVVPGAGHAVMLDNPVGFSAAVLSFLTANRSNGGGR